MEAVTARGGVRPARPDDLQQMVSLSYRLADKTMYAKIPRERPMVVKTMVSCMSSQFACAIVAERDGVVTGILLGVAQQYWWSSKRYATDLIFYSERVGDGLKMLRAFISWSKKVPNVVEITMGQSSGIEIERTASLYKRAGLKPIGGMYTKVLQETV